VVQLAAFSHPKTKFLFQKEVPNCPRGTPGLEVVTTDIEKLLSDRINCGRTFDKAKSQGQLQPFIIQATARLNNQNTNACRKTREYASQRAVLAYGRLPGIWLSYQCEIEKKRP
jgi:hypothetical protein